MYQRASGCVSPEAEPLADALRPLRASQADGIEAGQRPGPGHGHRVWTHLPAVGRSHLAPRIAALMASAKPGPFYLPRLSGWNPATF